MELDELDKSIVKILQKDSRRGVRDIARELKVSPATVHNRISKLIKMGVIRGFTTVLDYKMLGLDVTALILTSVDGKHIIDFEKDIAKHENVVAVYDITGDFDVAIISKFKNISELDKFVKSLLRHPYVKRTVTSIVLNVVKEDFRVKLPF